MPAVKDSVVGSPLEKVLQRILRSKDFPTISKYISEINKILSDGAIHSSASELANIILKDYALTNKLLKLVNSAFYGFVSGKVTTITRAVVLMGYENVRLAALSLLLFEHFKSKSAAKELKDATISSFWCGLVAKKIVKIQNKIDPEEAFICALLHQLGKLLVIYHFPQEYEKIRYHMNQNGDSEARAAQRVLGISYGALGLHIAEQWNFPVTILNTMTPISTEALEDQSQPIDPLRAVSAFSNALAHIIDTVPPSQRDAAMEQLLVRYKNYVNFSLKDLKALLDSCLDKLYKYAEALQLGEVESGFLMRLSGEHLQSGKAPDSPVSRQASRQASREAPEGDPEGDPEDLPVETAPAFRLAGDQEIDAAATLPNGEDTFSIIIGGIQEVSGAMMGDHDINDIALMSLEIIYRALRCQRAILFIHDSRNNSVEARYGYGADIHRLVGRVTFEIEREGRPDLFSQALVSGKDLIVEDARAMEPRALLPAWYRRNIDAKAFIFMPVAYQKVCVGAYYADADVAGTLVSALEHKYLAMLRNQLILDIKMGR
ncbi:MAG: HDOD domain-containing protein [Desulfobacteraceae bacterium]|jgi:HD-like signal output (HDOD) protein